MVARLSRRDATVDRLVEQAGDATWVALRGASGVGKSQLALLLGRRYSEARSWIRLRDLEPDQAAQRLLSAIRFKSPVEQDSTGLQSRLDETLGGLEPGSLLTLDDVPEFSDSDLLGGILVSMVPTLVEVGIRFMTTGVHLVPARILEMLPDQVRVLQAPPFTTAEAKELLVSFEAPDHIQESNLASFLEGVTGGHPVLLAAACKYLSDREWAADDSTLEGLLHTKYADEDVNPATVRALINTVEDQSARHLLYRLNISFRSYSMEEINDLARVQPPIDAPRERLAPLVGLWVQRDAGGTFSVSPLIRALGSSDLDREVARRCHAALAERLISQSTIGFFDFSQALVHLNGAGDYPRLAQLLLEGLMSYRELPGRPQFVALGLFAWEGRELPAEIPLDIQFLIRGQQLAVAAKQERDTRVLEADFERLMARRDEAHPLAVVAGNIAASQAFVVDDLPKAGRYLREVAQRWRDLAAIAGAEEGLLLPVELADGLVWLTAATIASPEEVEGWISLVQDLSFEERERLFQGVMGARGVVRVATALLPQWRDR